MVAELVLYPYGHTCPKCGLNNLILLSWCRGCDDELEVDHLHKVCVCGFSRIERCKDAPAPAPPQQPPPEAKT